MDKEGQEIQQPEEKKRKRFFLWVGRIVVSLILFNVAIILLVHFPPIQRWGLNKLTSSISKKLNSRVSIEEFTLNPISDLTLRNILIYSPEHPSDTLLYAEKLNVDYKRIWDILYRRITITQLGIETGMLNIHRVAGDSLTNLDLALLRLMPPKNPDKGDFVLDLKTVNAKSLHVRMDDEANGSLMSLYFKRADIELDTLDLIGKFVDIGDLDLDEPRIIMITRLPLVESTKMPASTSKTWSMDLDFVRITNAQIITDNRTKPLTFYPNGKGIDYAHMFLEDVDIAMDSLKVRG